MDKKGGDSMKTYQDLLAVGERDMDRMQFLLDAIKEHKQTEQYKIAVRAHDYYEHRNTTIMEYQKIVYDMLGRAKVDHWSANHKIPCRLFFYFVNQATAFLLGNGAQFEKEETAAKLGKDFDNRLQELLTEAQKGGVSFGFFNLDHVDVFSIREFVPLFDEETGAMKSGIRFWQIDKDKPLRITLYEPDGYTQYIRRKSEEIRILKDKQRYVKNVTYSEADGMEIVDGENYAGFPIVPMYGICKQSELVGMRNTIDAYDLMASDLVNNVDEANLIYWVLKNCDGMDATDDAAFVQRLKTMRVAHTNGDAGSEVEAHTVDVPYQASEAALNRLRSQLFEDAMALDVKQISAGNATATQIIAAYEPLNAKADLLEFAVLDFLNGIFELAGITDEKPTFKRSMITNQLEMTQMVMMAANELDSETILRLLPFLTPDMVDKIMERKEAEESERYEIGEEENVNELE